MAAVTNVNDRVNYLRSEVWQRMSDCIRVARYYEYRAAQYRRWHNTIRFLLYLSATSGIATFVEEALPPFYSIISGVFLAIFITIDFVMNMGRKADAARTLSAVCGILQTEWESLWSDINLGRVTNEEADVKMKELSRFESLMTQAADLSETAIDDEINKKCHYEVIDYLRSRYGAE